MGLASPRSFTWPSFAGWNVVTETRPMQYAFRDVRDSGGALAFCRSGTPMDSTQTEAERAFGENLRDEYAASVTFDSPDTARTKNPFHWDKTDRSTSTDLHRMAQRSMAREG